MLTRDELELIDNIIYLTEDEAILKPFWNLIQINNKKNIEKLIVYYVIHHLNWLIVT